MKNVSKHSTMMPLISACRIDGHRRSFWHGLNLIPLMASNRNIKLCHMYISDGLLWSWSYGSWIYNYLCNQWLSPLALWVQIPFRWGVLDTTSCQLLVADLWFSSGTPVSSTNKTDRHDITEILLKVTLNTITHNPYANLLL